MSQKIIYSPEDVVDLQKTEKVLLIDVRDSADYAQSHISGAVSVPDMFYHITFTTADAMAETQALFEKIFSEIGLTEDTLAIIYEDGLTNRYGGSCRGWWFTEYFGHKKVGVLDGGLNAWKKAGLSVDAETVSPAPIEFSAQPDVSMLATKDDVIDAMTNPAVKLLDNRDEVEWRCQSSSPYDADGKDFAPRRGRIPSAVWIEWYDFLDKSDIPAFKSKEEILELCAAQGLYPEDDIIVYCFKGSRASNTIIALQQAGFTKLRNYFGSWNEWSRDESLPAETGDPMAGEKAEKNYSAA